MSGNTIGKIFKITTFGSSHGVALGAVVDGCPAGLELSKKDIQKELDKRRPGTSKVTTSRGETDEVQVLSGIFEGKTDGTPIAAVVYNKDMDSSAYRALRGKPRPGHADYCWETKYEHYDYRGGGRASGRTTIGHVIGGAIAKKLLETLNIKVIAHVTKIGEIESEPVDLIQIEENIEKNAVRCADLKAAKEMEELILDLKEKGDSVGGAVEIIALNVPAGLGEPVFDKLDADIAKVLMGIGSVKGVEIGLGFKSSSLKGSTMNDEFQIDNNGIKTKTNNSGGILGGISDGMPIIARIAVKPTPSISKTQQTVDLEQKENTKIEIKGRHDPCICPRITSVAESSVAIIIVDHLIRSGFIGPCRL
ncbi:MAG: chorismate synthase [Methanobacterium sp.]|uniref:chorismate synthase n=1 Tax=Methanobacterium sp. TaxID=2164 RepID=UPI003D651C7A|nr:chorismate synthase [Methanobacterium sp.]